MRNLFLMPVAKQYARLQQYVHEKLRLNIPGFGFLLRRLDGPFYFAIQGQRMYFDPAVAGCYSRMIADRWNEPETHSFLANVLPKIDGAITFVDVGANVGEMVVDAARFDGVSAICAFEPIPVCANALRKTAASNAWTDKVAVYEKVVTDQAGTIFFSNDLRSANSSRIETSAASATFEVEATTLDDELCDIEISNLVLLIDVEGSEPRVLRGGKSLVARHQPLIIFEYNQVSKRAYRIDEVRAELPGHYRIFRLRGDGMLDGDLEKTWNCVAVPEGSQYSDICTPLVVGVAK